MLAFNIIGNCRLFISVFLSISKQVDVTADLPEWVKRVSTCPSPNNLSAWMKASAELKCSGLLNGTKSTDLKNIYHCMPTSFLNESVQFCSDFALIENGSCAVYTYEYGPNKTPNSKRCSYFRSGCPEQKYYSNNVYRYKSCNDIDPKRKCYLQDPRCATDYNYTYSTEINEINVNITKDEGSKYETSTSSYVLGSLLAIVIISIIVFFVILWKKKNCGPLMIKQRGNQRDDEEGNPLQEIRREANESEPGRNRTTDNEEGIPLQEIRREANESKPGRNRTTAESTESDLSSSVLTDTRENVSSQRKKYDNAEDIDIQMTRLHVLLYKIGGKLKTTSIKKIKFDLQAKRAIEIKKNKESKVCEETKVIEEDNEYKEIGRIEKGRDLLEFMNRKYDFNLNFYKLKKFLETVKEHELCKLCDEFFEKNKQLVLCNGHVSKEGRTELKVKLDKEEHNMSKDDIRAVQHDLHKVCKSNLDDDILVNGIAHGSLEIKFLVRNYLVDILRKSDFSILYKYGLLEVTLMGNCLYRCTLKEALTEELISDKASTESKETEWFCFKVSFEYAPKELAAHKRASEEIQSLLRGAQDLPDDSVIFVHHNKADIEEICFEIFKSAVTIKEEYPFISLEEVAERGQVVIFCYGEEAKHMGSFLYKSEMAMCLERVFVFIFQNEFKDWDFKTDADLKLLEHVFDKNNILLAQCGMDHLYEAYRLNLDCQFKNILRNLENSVSDYQPQYSTRVRLILEKLSKSNTNISSGLQTKCKELISSSNHDVCLIKGNIIWVFTDELLMEDGVSGKEHWNASASIKRWFRKHNIQIKSGLLRLHRFYTGTKLSHTMDKRIYGTLGMFATLKQNEKDIPICIGSPHSFHTGVDAYIQDADTTLKIGRCIWPTGYLRSFDMAVITLDKEVIRFTEKYHHEPLEIYDGKPQDLLNFKVFKFGAASRFTEGYVEELVEAYDGHMYGIKKTPNSQIFSTAGDSGSVVCTKINRKTYALGLIIGALERRCESPTSQQDFQKDTLILVSNLQTAISRFCKEMHGEIQNWHLKLDGFHEFSENVEKKYEG